MNPGYTLTDLRLYFGNVPLARVEKIRAQLGVPLYTQQLGTGGRGLYRRYVTEDGARRIIAEWRRRRGAALLRKAGF